MVCYSGPRKLIQQGRAFQAENVPEKSLWWGGGVQLEGEDEDGGEGGQAHLVTVLTSEPHSLGPGDPRLPGQRSPWDLAQHPLRPQLPLPGPSGDGTLPVSLEICHLGPTCPS